MTRITLRLPDEVHRRLVENSRLSGASLNQTIVDILSDAVGWGKGQFMYETPREAERRYIREALSDLSIQYHVGDLGPFLHKPAEDIDRDALFRALAGADLSGGIIEDRERSRY